MVNKSTWFPGWELGVDVFRSKLEQIKALAFLRGLSRSLIQVLFFIAKIKN
jgi:hypothetical protein